MDGTARSTRDIGRAAVREELARVAVPRFVEHGFDGVTFDALAAEAGVSRSTLLRYFAVKEDVVLFVFDPVGDAIVAVLGAAPAEDTEWSALRRSLDPAVAFLTRSDEGRVLLGLVWATPALYSRLHEKQAAWRPRMVERLAARDAADDAGALARRTRVAAALECLTVAIESWLAADGPSDLGALLDATFEAVRTVR